MTSCCELINEYELQPYRALDLSEVESKSLASRAVSQCSPPPPPPPTAV